MPYIDGFDNSIIQRSEELGLYNLVQNFFNYKPRLKSGISKRISWLNGLFLEEKIDKGFTNVSSP
jgi:hypothetical protein